MVPEHRQAGRARRGVTGAHDHVSPKHRPEPGTEAAPGPRPVTAGGAEPGADEWLRLGTRLKEVREYLGLSQQHVSARTGIPRSAVSEIERGRRKVDSLELRKFSKLYRYPVSYLLGDDEGHLGEAAVGAAPPAIAALARAVGDLTEQDQAELLKFAQFLRLNSRRDVDGP